MIDLRALRDNPDKFKDGCRKKGFAVDIDHILALDARKRQLMTERERLRAEQGKIEKELGPQLGRLGGQIKQLQREGKAAEAAALQREVDDLKARPAGYKAEGARLEAEIAQMDPQLRELLLAVPLPPDSDVPVGTSAADNVEIKRWNPPGFDASKPFESQRGFTPRNHIDLVRALGLADIERGVKLAGTRSYVLTGDGMRLHQAVLRYAMEFMTERQGFTPVSVPVVVREEAMVGTGFFPAGREQAYHIPESQRQSADDAEGKAKGSDLFLTGTGEVGLMGLYGDEILDEASLPLRLCTVSTCFRREAGAAGKDTAGLYRIHQFDKVEQVVICKADEAESRAWHKRMIGYVEEILQSLRIPYRLLQCCTGDLGPKNADMVDIESWMPGRGESKDGVPTGAYGETHSASRLYDYQCRRLNMRYRAGGAGGKGETVFCHSLNNTVIASPRVLIPILENHQNQDGSVTIPEPLRPYMGGRERIG
ncbi:MAG: serine--tRNA ligase [Phycisphaerae bacterium]|nr:serine--tRNA ligase [Phycisphaerae bacterium]